MTSSNASGLSGARGKSLWARAPLWRFCVSTAVLLSLAVVCFPPTWRKLDVKPPPLIPDVATYQSPPSGAAPISMPPAIVAESKPAVTKVEAVSPSQKHVPTPTRPGVVASAAVTTKPSAVADVTATTPPIAKAPITATISMAVPGVAAKPDVSGLDRALLGRTYQQSIAVEGFDVPLPPGQWAVLANSTVHTHSAAGMAYFLGRIEHQRLAGAIRLFAVRSNDQPGAGFPAANGCTTGNPNVNYLHIDSVTAFDHQACWLINNFFTPPLQQWADHAVKITALDRAAAGDLAAKGVSYPQDLIDVRFTRAETWGLLEISYLFNPEVDGISSNTALSVHESDWHAPNVPKFPEKVAYLTKIQGWGENFWPKFQQAFVSGQSGAPLAQPDPASQP